jgi:hypothetical protein
MLGYSEAFRLSDFSGEQNIPDLFPPATVWKRCSKIPGKSASLRYSMYARLCLVEDASGCTCQGSVSGS